MLDPEVINPEKKQCTKCFEIKLRDEFWKEPRCLDGLRPECKRCHTKIHNSRETLLRLRAKLRARQTEAVWRAIIRILKEDTDLLNMVTAKHQLRFKKYVVEERFKIAAELKESSLRQGKKKNSVIDQHEIWKDIEDELYSNQGLIVFPKPKSPR